MDSVRAEGSTSISTSTLQSTHVTCTENEGSHGAASKTVTMAKGPSHSPMLRKSVTTSGRPAPSPRESDDAKLEDEINLFHLKMLMETFQVSFVCCKKIQLSINC